MKKMKKSIKKMTMVACAVTLFGLTGYLQANESAGTAQAPVQTEQFTPAQQQEIAAIVAKTLISNPSILVQSVQALKQQQAQMSNQTAINAIVSNAAALVADPVSPSIGNQNAPITLIEFFDYSNYQYYITC